MINKSRPLKFWRLMMLLVSAIFIASCHDDKDSTPAPSVTNEANAYVNNWILDNMKFWYYWSDQLPASPDVNQDPETFFESILSTQDKFSWIQNNYQDLLNSLKGISKEAGYEFVLYRENESGDNVIAQVVYVKPGSDAETAGLKRGDVISHINGTQITTSNYRDLLDAIHENHSIRYKPLLVEEQVFDAEKTISLSTSQYSENPNYLHKILTVDNHKIGYYIYNFFASGTDDTDTKYDDEMNSIFGKFKAAGITDLIIDLRYNSGGAETSANALASLIGTGVDDSKVFAKREYNSGVKTEILNDPKLGESFLTSHFSTRANNVGSMLSSTRVYILTSSRTASASELVINVLKPYMDVFLIGDTTYGKNVGSISLYEENDAKNKYGIQPIVLKIYNSLDQSDYASGFTPNVADKDNSLFIYPLGDTREALLSQAIAQITGTATTGRLQKRRDAKEAVGFSLDAKRRSFNLIIDQKIPR
jgi:carboxyl-terminal processing protease